MQTRRRLLKTVFCSSTALALNLRPSFVNAADDQDMHMLAIGDFGSMEPAQTAVAKGMAGYTQRLKLKPEALLLVGDNFYKPMPGGLQAPRWKTGFEDMYPASVFNCPCPVVLGNHDYHDNKGGEQTQLAYAKQGGTRWTMPAKWYRMELPKVNPLVTMLFIDTNIKSLSGSPDKDGKPRNFLQDAEAAEQWAWLKAELAKPHAPFLVVVGHHPVYSNANHGDSKELVQKLQPMLQSAGVHAYLCGHDHDLQHLEMEGQKTSYVLSGAGGARLYPIKSERPAPYAQPVYGFTHLQANKERLIFRHVDANGKQVHAFEKRLDYSWKEVS